MVLGLCIGRSVFVPCLKDQHGSSLLEKSEIILGHVQIYADLFVILQLHDNKWISSLTLS